ncbi:3-isopropylmalate dehydratase small subunit [Parasphingorhabdus halotolerans]|uniref:3-isopropylmalate dehydratase small subunit n=1 Tax=Parasphingorhabdus halotolerans TaxID=2725558 RepID=A0A6H2DJM8_9SPHN|nr:3-isopropylmalate dehydratase small subunit [Parasphingorhabdus halotolerans]QJB68882.1 3-isopropylmalate dehydratase small subunit [Parasphingorhabdus halotolerans]
MSAPVRRVEGRAIPFGRKNVDTDVIISAKWLKTISREGLGRGAFESIRAQDGNIFDSPENIGAPILIAGDNFGCGSSREHAAWALDDMGIKAIIAPSFSDIFSGNAFKNGLLAIALPQAAIDRLMDVAKTDPITIDMESMSVTTPFQDRFVFEMDPFRQQCLMEGLDEIDLTMAKSDAIEQHEQKTDSAQPWLTPAAA